MRPPIITLTPAALERLAWLCQQQSDPSPEKGFRLTLKKGGCAGFSYQLTPVSAPEKGDDVIQQSQARLYVAPQAVLFLLGTEMDFEQTKFSAGFVFRNPNQTGACGCGESVSLKAATLVEKAG